MVLEILNDDRAFLRGPRSTLTRSASPLRVVDMFSGCGGLTLGVEEAAKASRMSMEVRLAIEIDPHIRRVYADNFRVAGNALGSDVRNHFDRAVGSNPSARERKTVELVGPRLDVLVGGPPCQGHSTLNNHTRGDDPKNRLYLSMVRATELLKPRIVVIENVPAIERDSGSVVERAKSFLQKLDYGVETAVVSIADFGVPQLRKRHVLVALKGQKPHFVEDLQSSVCGKHRSLKWAIRDLQRARGSKRSSWP